MEIIIESVPDTFAEYKRQMSALKEKYTAARAKWEAIHDEMESLEQAWSKKREPFRKPKKSGWEGYREPGRDQEPDNGWR